MFETMKIYCSASEAEAPSIKEIYWVTIGFSTLSYSDCTEIIPSAALYPVYNST